jgi:hypothetical protein
MTPAQRTARACQTGASLSAAIALVAAAWHPLLIVPGLAGAAFLWWAAASARTDEARQQARHAALDRAAAADEQILPADPGEQRSAA